MLMMQIDLAFDSVFLQLLISLRRFRDFRNSVHYIYTAVFFRLGQSKEEKMNWSAILCCFVLHCFVFLVVSAPRPPPPELEEGTASGPLSKSRRSVQYTSSFRSSDCSEQEEMPRNCYHAKLLGHSVSGVYEIDPRDGLGSFNVYCDMQTDGGGWTVFQRRQDGSEDFDRTWLDYRNGFGELYGEFWLGLDKIHRLTTGGVTLRVDLTAPDTSKAYAKYEDFTVGNAKSMYVMYLGRYTGTAGDSFSYHKGMKFTTKDKDNDQLSGNCAVSNGAWWHKNCHNSNLNGFYNYGVSGTRYVVWHGHGGFKGTTSLQKVEMKLKL